DGLDGGLLVAGPALRVGRAPRAIPNLQPAVCKLLGVAAPLDDDLVLGLVAGEPAGLGEGVEDVVLVGRQIDRSPGAAEGLREEGAAAAGEAAAAAGTAEAAAGAGGHGALVLAEDQDVVGARAEQGDDDPLLARLQDLAGDGVGADEGRLGLGQVHAP